MQKSALSEMPDQCAREVARQPSTAVSAVALFSSRLQRAAHVGPTDVAEQKDSLLALVRGLGNHLAGTSRRSQTSRRGDRLLQHPAYLGTDLATSSAHSLCGAR